MLILDPESRRISVILDPARPLEKRKHADRISRMNLTQKPTDYSHNATDHIAGDRDRLSPQVGVVLAERTASGKTGRRQAATSLGSPSVTSELRSSSAHPPLTTSKGRSGTGPSNSSGRSGNGSSTESSSQNTLVTSSSGLVVDSALTPLPITVQALSDLMNGLLDGFNASLNLNNSLGGLGEHLLGSNHTGARSILDLLDGGTRLSDDTTHQVVGDEQTHGSEGVAGKVFGIGERGLEQSLGNLGKGLGNNTNIFL
jgi:hypothetical protein